MTQSRSFARYWLPVLAWMAVIFAGSSTAGSTENTSRFLKPLLQWLLPGISETGIHHAQVAIRKCSHVVEYAILAALLWRARRRAEPGDARPWDSREALWAVVGAGLYAVTDELHQHFVPGRQGSGWDVLLDTLGGILGIVSCWMLGRLRGRW